MQWEQEENARRQQTQQVGNKICGLRLQLGVRSSGCAESSNTPGPAAAAAAAAVDQL
jgi:hypothetical protein